MKLHVINSGSIGNCYILETTKGDMLMIDAGVNFKAIQQQIDFKYNKVVACLLSHEHGDHAKSIKNVVEKCIHVMTSKDTAEAIGIEKSNYFIECNHNTKYRLDKDFIVIPFNLIHDVPCFGFSITHPECGELIFATDTNELNYLFPEANHFLIESNYCMYKLADLEMNGNVNQYVTDRVKRSHLSIQKCVHFLSKHKMDEVQTITLIHLSDSNSDQYSFRNDVIKLTGKPTYIAEKGLTVDITLNPFEFL